MFRIFIILAGIFAYPLFGAEEKKPYFDTIPNEVIINNFPSDPFDFSLGTYHNRTHLTREELETDAFCLSLGSSLYHFTGALKFVAHVISNKVESSKISPDQVVKLLEDEKSNLEPTVFIKTVFGECFTKDKFKHLHTQEFKKRFIPIFFDVCKENGVMPIYISLDKYPSSQNGQPNDNPSSEYTHICNVKEDTIKYFSDNNVKNNGLSYIQFNSMPDYIFAYSNDFISHNNAIHIYVDPKKIIIKRQPDEMHLVADIDLQDPQRSQIMGLFFKKHKLRLTNKYLLPEDMVENHNAALTLVNTFSQDHFLKQKITPIPQEWCYGWKTTKIMLANLCKSFNTQCVATYYAAPWCMQKLTGFCTSPLIATMINTANYLFFQYQPKHPENYNPLSRFIHYFEHPFPDDPLRIKLLIPLLRLLSISSPCIISKFFPSVLPSICAMWLCIRFFSTIYKHSPLFKYQNITYNSPIRTKKIDVTIFSKKV